MESPKPPKNSEQTQNSTHVPYRQIRALYDEKSITVYMAFSSAIAIPAVREQNLSASPDFLMDRMTWIKPSWCWMMYRSNYSYKDPNQAHILSIKTSRRHFQHLLALASLSSSNHHSSALTLAEKSKPVRVQWDPERSPSLRLLPYRSIQISLSRDVKTRWVREWITSIEDVTHVARELKRVLESEGEVGLEELVRRGLVPREEVYGLEPELRELLGMEQKRGDI